MKTMEAPKSKAVRPNRGGRIRALPAVAGLAAATLAVAACGPSNSAPGGGPHRADTDPTATASPHPGGTTGKIEATHTTKPAPANPATIQAFGERVFSFSKANSNALTGLIVHPASVAGQVCVAVYSNRGWALAAETSGSDVGELPPAGTKAAMVSACETGDSVTQVATTETKGGLDTLVLDVTAPVTIKTLGHEHADGSGLRTTHDVSDGTLLADANHALTELQSDIGNAVLAGAAAPG